MKENKKVSQIAYGLDTYNGTDEIVDCFASIQLTNDFAKPRLAEWTENPWFAKMIDERKSTYPESLQWVGTRHTGTDRIPGRSGN